MSTSIPYNYKHVLTYTLVHSRCSIYFLVRIVAEKKAQEIHLVNVYLGFACALALAVRDARNICHTPAGRFFPCFLFLAFSVCAL